MIAFIGNERIARNARIALLFGYIAFFNTAARIYAHRTGRMSAILSPKLISHSYDNLAE